MFVRERVHDHSTTLERPGMVLSSEHRTIKPPDGRDFFTGAREHWPTPRWTVELDPWQLAPEWPGR
jgi:hypothetical protein